MTGLLGTLGIPVSEKGHALLNLGIADALNRAQRGNAACRRANEELTGERWVTNIDGAVVASAVASVAPEIDAAVVQGTDAPNVLALYDMAAASENAVPEENRWQAYYARSLEQIASEHPGARGLGGAMPHPVEPDRSRRWSSAQAERVLFTEGRAGMESWALLPGVLGVGMGCPASVSADLGKRLGRLFKPGINGTLGNNRVAGAWAEAALEVLKDEKEAGTALSPLKAALDRFVRTQAKAEAASTRGFRRVDQAEYAAARAQWDKPLAVVGAGVCEALNGVPAGALDEKFWMGLRSEAVSRLHGVFVVEAKEAEQKFMQQHQIKTDDWTRNTSTGVLLVAGAMRTTSFLERAANEQPLIGVAAAKPALQETAVKCIEGPKPESEACLAEVSHIKDI